MSNRIPGARALIIGVPVLWLVLFFLLPFVLVGKISISAAQLAQPPYGPLFEGGDWQGTLASFAYLIQDSFYFDAYFRSLRIALVATVITLLIGYPLAYAMARSPRHLRNLWLMLLMLPFWTSLLIRVYAWKVLLQGNGLLNTMLLAVGIIDEPLTILYTDAAIYLGIVYSYLPFMVLPLYVTLERLDLSLNEAAADLGAPPWRVFASVTLPLSLPGIVAGCGLVFIPAVGEYVIPELLGGPEAAMIGRVLWNEFFLSRDWPLASAVAVAILVALVVPIALFQRYQGRTSGESA